MTAATPTTSTDPAASSNREPIRPRTSTAVAMQPHTSTAAATPSTPAGHGAEACGRAAAPCAMPPTAAAGTHATAASAWAPAGHTGATVHAASPITVTTGANGSASRFAGTA
ncbi:hypothetical protein NYS52_13210 [Curtobacterium flaccumfaciens pv. flaccumfaciens]|nr:MULTISPECIES: hypothetical protein [Curtobacterium]MCS6575488.1 hypothetical protein [Curtobacterium flaccumfaciens pv. flaccumfaciens]MCS6577198.1 hypothetical protein [Curtobacterium flaccumfaciens]MCU0114730.1 hypothetical protein [Curtobacterium flaccumfaciens]MDD1384762.1 hypothetical protein [Curtobacterium flaccumfaciens pv. poinsettiae]